MFLVRVIGWAGIVLATLILFRNDQDHAVWRSVIFLGGALVLLYLPDDYEFTLRHLSGLAVLFSGFWLYYIGVENWNALGAFSGCTILALRIGMLLVRSE